MEFFRETTDYLQALGALKEGFRELLAFLKKSVPFFSMRYQGHMNWEVTLPGLLGYFAAMLYNPNNVAFEGATATTILELLVGDDLCRMLGYDVPATKDVRPGAIRPWGHITCDGTVANIEAIWSARNLKLYPLAVREAIAEDAALAPARKLEISLPTGASAQLVDLGAWQLLNLDADRVLELPTRLANDFGISRQLLTASVGRYSAQNLGLGPFARKFLSGIPGAPAVFVPGSKHYSFPKAAALLGLGADNLIDVAVEP